MIDDIRKILSSENCYKNRLNCIDDGTCRDCENERLSKLMSKHDSELLDKVAEKLTSRRYYMETEEGWGGFTVTDKDIDEVIAEMKAEVNEC